MGVETASSRPASDPVDLVSLVRTTERRIDRYQYGSIRVQNDELGSTSQQRLASRGSFRSPDNDVVGVDFVGNVDDRRPDFTTAALDRYFDILFFENLLCASDRFDTRRITYLCRRFDIRILENVQDRYRYTVRCVRKPCDRLGQFASAIDIMIQRQENAVHTIGLSFVSNNDSAEKALSGRTVRRGR